MWLLKPFHIKGEWNAVVLLDISVTKEDVVELLSRYYATRDQAVDEKEYLGFVEWVRTQGIAAEELPLDQEIEM